MRTAVIALGALCILAGLVFMFAPTLLHDPGPAPDTFEAIERRVMWGALAGLGVFLVARKTVKPWSTAIASFACYVSTGFIVARFVGLGLDGFDSPRQWMWIGVEAVIVAAGAGFLWYKARSGASKQPTSTTDTEQRR